MTWKEVLALLHRSEDVADIDSRREEIVEWMPRVRIMFGYDQNNNYHQYDLWMHALHTVVGIDKSIDDDMLYLAALLHDIGKPASRCKGKREDDIYSHYYGHPEVSEQIVREEIVPHIISKGGTISQDDIQRLLYYVKYHDDHVNLRVKSVRRHLKIVDIETFKKLMALEVADAKAHVIFSVIQERIDVCQELINGRADMLKEKIEQEDAKLRSKK